MYQNPTQPFAADYAAQGQPFAADYAADAASSANSDYNLFGFSGAEVKGFGQAMAIGGVATSAISTFFDVSVQKIRAKDAAGQARFDGTVADMQARSYEDQAYWELEQGNAQISLLSQSSAHQQSAQVVDSVKRGVAFNSGSAAEVKASMELAKQMDVRTIKTNSMRKSNARMLASVNARNTARFARVSARNLDRQASSMNPWLASLSGAAGAAGNVAALYST